MKLTRSLWITIFLLSIALPASAQSLGDMGRKEMERRAKIKEEPKVIANYDVYRYRGGAVATSNLPAPPAAEKSGGDQATTTPPGTAQGAPAAAGAKANPDEPTDLTGRTESFWKQTFTDARQKVKELENLANVLTLKINDLQNQFYRESDGFKQQTLNRELQKAYYEQDQNKENLAKAKAAIDDLEKDARKSGALPGWINPKP